MDPASTHVERPARYPQLDSGRRVRGGYAKRHAGNRSCAAAAAAADRLHDGLWISLYAPFPMGIPALHDADWVPCQRPARACSQPAFQLEVKAPVVFDDCILGAWFDIIGHAPEPQAVGRLHSN
jgi:hypothetical protein